MLSNCIEMNVGRLEWWLFGDWQGPGMQNPLLSFGSKRVFSLLGGRVVIVSGSLD